MKTYIAVASAATAPPQKFEDITITTGAILGGILLAGTVISGIVSLVKLTVAANNLKHSFEQMDSNIAQQLNNVSDRVNGGFSRIDKEWGKLDRRITYHDLRIDDMERFLHKNHDYAIRKYYPTEGDRLGDSI